MDLKIKKNFIAILLVTSVCSSCVKSEHANKVVGDNSTKPLKNNATINLTTYHIPRESSKIERDVVSRNIFQRKTQYSKVSAEFPKNLISGSTSRKSRSHRGRIRISNNTKENFQMKFPEGFSPSAAPYHPLLYPFATATPPALQINDPWKPIKYSETTTISPFNVMKDDDSLSPTQLDSLRETIIYGLPKLNSRESVEQEADFGADIRVVKPLNSIKRKESSVIPDTDDAKLKSFLPEGVKIDLLRQSAEGTAELIQYPKEKEMGAEKMNSKNKKSTSFTEGFNKSRSENWVSAESTVSSSASTALNADYRRLNQTTWPPTSSEEKIFYDSSVSDLHENRAEVDDSTLDTPKSDSYINNVEASATYHTLRLRQPFIDHTTKNEPTICIPMYFKETTASTGSEQLVNVERVYCFPFPPEFKINFNGANEPARVEIAQEEWINNESISNGNRFKMNIILLLTVWMVFLMTKRLQHL